VNRAKELADFPPEKPLGSRSERILKPSGRNWHLSDYSFHDPFMISLSFCARLNEDKESRPKVNGYVFSFDFLQKETILPKYSYSQWLSRGKYDIWEDRKMEF